MKIGVPKEIKPQENRIGLTPDSVKTLVSEGHEVIVENNGGFEAGFENDQYTNAGAKIASTAADIFNDADIIVKVKEPQKVEVDMIRENQIVYTYLHLAAAKELTEGLIKSKSVNIAYETVTDDNGRLPLLAPMSEVAGRMSIQAAATHLEKTHGGLGLLMAGVPGVAPAKVVILGAGVVGRNALQMAVGMGAQVCIFDRDIDRLRQIDALYGNRVRTYYADPLLVEIEVCEADVVIGAVLLPGAAAPKLVTRDMVKKMKSGAIVVDVAIDQGGCFETSRPTTHADPTFVVDGVLHYCVANMPGAVARTSTFALTNATYPYVEALANKGIKAALFHDCHLRNGLSIHQGRLTSEPVARAQNVEFVSADELMAA